MVATVDKLIIASTGLVAIFLIAHFSDTRQVGLYVLAVSVLVFLVVLHQSLVSQSCLIQRLPPCCATVQQSAVTLTLSLLFSAVSILILSVVALGLLAWGARRETLLLTLSILASAPFVLTRDLSRFAGTAPLARGGAVLLDLASAAIQLSALYWLGSSARMSAWAACAALGGASGLTAAAWLYVTQSKITARKPCVRNALGQMRALGKWLLAGRIVVQAQGCAISGLLVAFGGARLAGVFAGCVSIVWFASPLLDELCHRLRRKSALTWETGGGLELWRETSRSAALIAALMTAFSLTVWWAGAHVMQLLYRSPEYAGQGLTLTVLGLGLSAAAIGAPAANGLAAIDPRPVVLLCIATAVLRLALVAACTPEWGLLGAACGLLGASIAGAAGRWVAFSRRIPELREIRLPARAFVEIMNIPKDDAAWTVKRVGNGSHAEAFLIEATSPAASLGHHQVVVKLYRPSAALTFEMVQDQFESLSKLHAMLAGCVIEGWRISAAGPIGVSKSPLGLIMTPVSGAHIDACLSSAGPGMSKFVHDAARVLAIAMEHCWSSKACHGDLALQNVLFDVQRKVISLIDAGTRESCRTCNATLAESLSASDLAHLVYDVTSRLAADLTLAMVRTFPGCAFMVFGTVAVADLSVRSMMGREAFVENFLRTVFEDIASSAEKRLLLDNVCRFAHRHSDDDLDASWSPNGVWSRSIKEITDHRIDALLASAVCPDKICGAPGEAIEPAVQATC